jgi:NADP-dependent 3-hydroxy acid dehydrogenase YdfG
MSLEGNVCIVTGGGSGIGRATALKLAARGASVAVVGRSEPKLHEVCADIQARGGTARPYAVDVADFNGVQAMARAVLDGWGRIDILVNNAGHSSQHRRLLSTTPEEIRAVVDSNLIGSIYCAKAVVPAMLEQKRGTIVNVASLAGTSPNLLAGMIYSAVKAAVINFNAYLNAEFRNSGIRAGVVIPGEVDTPIMDKRPTPPDSAARATMVPAEDVADAIMLIAAADPRTTIPELVIRPTFQRNTAPEIERA